MNKTQKNFILNELIPFIMREQGRGFGMSYWSYAGAPGEKYVTDEIVRAIPKCGTVACIGGSIECLRPFITPEKMTGLSNKQLENLFYGWDTEKHCMGWPRKFHTRYARAKTTLGKAKVACDLLRKVVKTNGKCLPTEE